MTYGSALEFEGALKRISAQYEEKARPITELPTLRDLRVALNVAAADMRPLVVVRADKAPKRGDLVELVAELAWEQGRVGRFHFVVLEEEISFEGLVPEEGVHVIQPDPFGLGGTVLASHGLKASSKQLAGVLDEGLEAFTAKAREHDQHVREARRRGIRWETAIPVTDTHGREGPRRRAGRGREGRGRDPRERDGDR